MATIGYARVLSREQHLDMQLAALRQKSCNTFSKKRSRGFVNTQSWKNACLICGAATYWWYISLTV